MDLALQIDEYLNSKDSNAPAKERDYFHISELGKSKKEIYDNIKLRKAFKFDARVKRILDNGNYMHERYYKYLAEMGILIGAEIDAVRNDLFHGRADAIITDKEKNYILDLKSCSQWTFQKLTDPQHDHKLQLMFYMYYLNIPNGMILYENKDNQAIKIFEMQLDKELVEKYISEFQKLKEDIKNNIVPDDKPITLEDIQYGI